MEKTAKIYVAGHHGLVGSAIWNNLQQKGYTNLVGRSHKERPTRLVYPFCCKLFQSGRPFSQRTGFAGRAGCEEVF